MFRFFIHSFSCPLFLLGGLREQLPGCLEIPHVNSNLTSFCWLHTNTGTSKVGDVL